MSKIPFALAGLALVLALAPAALAEDPCSCCRVECLPATTQVVERQVACPPVTSA